MYQADFMALYDNLERYVTYKARRYIHDESQRIEAVDDGMAKFVDSAQFTQEGDELLSPIADLLAWGKEVIRNSLKDFVKKKKELKPVVLRDGEASFIGEQDGFHGMELNG